MGALSAFGRPGVAEMAGDTSARDRRGGDRRRRPPEARDSGEPVQTSQAADFGPDTQVADSRFVSREEASARGGALVRVVRGYIAARAVVGVALVLAQGVSSASGERASTVIALWSVAYAVQAIVLWLLPRFQLAATGPREGRRWRWLATIGVDLFVFSLLQLLESTVSFNFAALLVLPVLMAGVLLPRLAGLAVTSLVALVLLFGAWRFSNGDAEFAQRATQAGLAGMGFFIIALLAGELAARLAGQEVAARGSLELARQQAQLNRLVIQEMADGVMVIDGKLRVRAANPAARALLVAQGMAPPAPFDLRAQAAWQVLVRAVEDALVQGNWPELGKELSIAFDDGQVRGLRVRARFTRAGERDDRDDADADADAGRGDERYCVLLLEDARTAQARLRQEKLAAMGRVSAGIAHEIRNPLAAIAQANELLLEDPLSPDQTRLARMVADNVQRLKRIVDDVMEVAPGMQTTPGVVDASAVTATAVAEWARTAGLVLGANSRLRVDLPDGPLGVRFDAEHLRRVLVNLLDNALRHASSEPAAVFLRLAARPGGRVRLQVFSDGEAIAPEVERFLFEPFFSTRSRGSGLGLYICRELCRRSDASIEYRRRPLAEPRRNEFVVTMRQAALPAVDATLPLNP